MLHRRDFAARNQFLSRLSSYNNSGRRTSRNTRQIQLIIVIVVIIIFGTCLVAVNYQGPQIRQQIDQDHERREINFDVKNPTAIPKPVVPKFAEIKPILDEKVSLSNRVEDAEANGSPEKTPFASLVKEGSPLNRVAVVLVCYNRPDYLERTLSSLASIWPSNDTLSNVQFSLIFSQDGNHVEVTNVIKKYMKSSPGTSHISFAYDADLWQSKYPQPFMQNLAVYYRISAHYNFILSTVMKESEDYNHILFIEDDMLFAPDFFHYFAAVSSYLDRYKSVFCASAWNDNGQEAFVDDPRALFRTDVFPGLGWMMTRDVALELLSKWPAGFWDDWLRDSEQRKGRSCIFPEINRAKTFGSDGSSKGEFFSQYLAPIRLNDDFIDWTLETEKLTSVFDESIYDEVLWLQVKKATPISIQELSKISDLESLRNDDMFRIDYRTESEFQKIAQQLNCMPEWKSGIPRASYSGISLLRIRKSRLFFIKKN